VSDRIGATTIGATVARVADRVRPWRAPAPEVTSSAVAVIGAGPAGLATAALLRRQGLRAVIVDRHDAVGGSWPDRYDSLRLNTVRWMSDLPGRRADRDAGRWTTRNDLVAYLRDYADHHRLEVRTGVSVDRIDERDGWWELALSTANPWSATTERFAGVVVATGHSALPRVPSWPGTPTARLLHAVDYRRPDDHRGRSVLVVGAGSSGGEICVDLVAAGVEVVWSVRTAPQVFPREVLGVPTTPFAPFGDLLPDRWLDRIGPWVERRIYGRRDYLPPATSTITELFARCKEPMTADGIVAAVRRGDVRVVAPVIGWGDPGVELDDGSTVAADDVIAATGYRPGLEPLVGHLGVLGDDGRPRALVPRSGLAFVGFRIPFTGTLWAIDTDARRVASAIAHHVHGRPDS